MARPLLILAMAAMLGGCTAIGNIGLPSKQEVASALQAMFDGHTRAGNPSKPWRLPPGDSAPQVSSLEITKWKLIEDTYLVADVHAMLTTKDATTVQVDPQRVNFRLLMERRKQSWILLDLVPIAEPRIVET